MYHVVIQHIKASIEKHFMDNSMDLDLDRIVWAITVPAIAQLEQKNFMIQAFKNGMGEVGPQKKAVTENHVQVVLEPEGGFLYALHT